MSCFNIYRILLITKPIKSTSIVVNRLGKDISRECRFSWSSDNVCWTNFTTYENYLSICKNIESDYYLRIRFTGDIPQINLDGLQLTCYTIYIDNANRFEIQDCSNNEFCFFDNITCALLIQQQMADKIACLFGLPAYYFRVLPDKSTKELTFKEYTLHDVDDVKMVRLVIPDGQMPSSRPNFTDFDFDWEVDWEVEMSKTHFARAFGDTAFPKQRDFIYIPMMKRMYEVNSAYDEKEGMLMWQSTTWKLGLIKWNEKTNIDYTGFEDIIDKWVVNKFDIEPEILEQEVDSGVTDVRMPLFIPNNVMNIYMTDSVRHSITENTIADFSVNHKNISITRNKYMFGSPGYVRYQKEICGDCGTLTFVLEHVGGDFQEHPIVQFGEVCLVLSPNGISDGKISIDLEPGIYIINYVWNYRLFTTELSAYRHTIADRYRSLPPYKVKPDMYTFDYYNGATGAFNNDYIMISSMPCAIYPYDCSMSNIKLYKQALDGEELKKEMLKYTTKHEHIIFNDNCVPFESGFGSSNK